MKERGETQHSTEDLSKQQESNSQLLCFPPQLLIDWINTTLKQEHIVVKSLEEDLYDGLVLHHLLGKLPLWLELANKSWRNFLKKE